MRVIWISVGLFVALVASFLYVYEPQPVLEESQVARPSPEITNPFVENKTEQPPEIKPAELTVAPSILANQGQKPEAGVAQQQPVAQSETVQSRNVQSPSVQSASSESQLAAKVQPGLTQAAENSRTSQDAAGQTSVTKEMQSSNELAQMVLDDGTLNEKDNKLATANEPAPQKTEEKKLGLAMIAFEKEKQKNKIAIIVHKSNSQILTEKEIKALYMDRLTRWEDGSRVMLYNLPLGDRFRDKFSQSILKMSALEADKQETRRRELRIKANDVEVKSKNVIVSYVEQHPNAVAYVPLNLVRKKSQVKVIMTIP